MDMYHLDKIVIIFGTWALSGIVMITFASYVSEKRKPHWTIGLAGGFFAVGTFFAALVIPEYLYDLKTSVSNALIIFFTTTWGGI